MVIRTGWSYLHLWRKMQKKLERMSLCANHYTFQLILKLNAFSWLSRSSSSVSRKDISAIASILIIYPAKKLSNKLQTGSKKSRKISRTLTQVELNTMWVMARITSSKLNAAKVHKAQMWSMKSNNGSCKRKEITRPLCNMASSSSIFRLSYCYKKNIKSNEKIHK